MVDVQQNGDVVVLVDAHEVLHDLTGGDGVEGGDRLVGQDDFRVLVQGTGQSHALLLAAGELVAAGIGLGEDADLVQTFEGAHFLLLREDAEKDLEKAHVRHVRREHVLDGGGAADQVKALEDHAHLAAVFSELRALEGVDVHTVNGEGALGHVMHAVDAAENRGLACAGQADDGHKLPLLDLEVYVLERGEAVGIGLVDILKFNHTAAFLPLYL